MRNTVVARRLGVFFVLGTAVAVLLAVVLRTPLAIGPVTVTPSGIFRWWLVVGLAVAAIGFAIEGTGAVKQAWVTGCRREAVLQTLLSAVAVGVLQ
jgi:steroid 5-alpha reductase family enzyme